MSPVTGKVPLVVVHILHGMMEHSARYKSFAEWLEQKGAAVYVSDLPGHGTAIDSPGDLGHIPDKDGWKMILQSVKQIQDQIRADHPGAPVVMLGHSFGSVVARSFVQSYGDAYPLQGLILSGAMQQQTFMLRSGLALVALQKEIYGSRHRSKLMITLGHGRYGKHFSPKRTEFDWLSSDPAVVDAYVADPLCGYACTLGFYGNFLQAMLETWQCRNIRKMPADMPVLLMGGQLDPATNSGKDTRALEKRYLQCDMKQVAVKLWKNGRHEMLNEVNKPEVWQFIADWILDSWQ